MQSKIHHVLNLVIAAACVFGILGSIVRPGALLPFAILLVVVMGWASSYIIRQGIASAMAIFGKDDSDKTE
jgi:predicted membrane channel-forming protein YqfA (hemolysin III family)